MIVVVAMGVPLGVFDASVCLNLGLLFAGECRSLRTILIASNEHFVRTFEKLFGRSCDTWTLIPAHWSYAICTWNGAS